MRDLSIYTQDTRLLIISASGTDYDAFVTDQGTVNGVVVTLRVEFRAASRHSLDRQTGWSEGWIHIDHEEEGDGGTGQRWLEVPDKDDAIDVRSIVRV